ncbi:hypothetical protein AAG570_007744 [Ranatra chinensis]|uniref:Uncharacterized protein n=1 Tax=Ranatra chinensis TaxID=642074 RepID=A0ABD0YIA6_9HEMI
MSEASILLLQFLGDISEIGGYLNEVLLELWCEELLLDEVQRKHDGYYINCERFDRIINSDLSDHEPEIRTKKKSLKRIADSDDEYCTEETMNKIIMTLQK